MSIMFKKLFLPVGMCLVVLVALLTPAPGLWLKENIGTSAMIMAIFLISGMQADFRELQLGKRFFGGLLLGGLFTLAILSFMGWGMLFATPLDPMLLAGLLVMLAAPPTLSSGIVMTVQAQGNMMLAVAITVLFNLGAILTLPIVLGFLLSEAAADGVDAWQMFRSLIVLVLIPLFIGYTARRFLLRGRWHKTMDYIPLLATLALIGVIFSTARTAILSLPWSMLILVLALCGIFHLAAMAGLWGIGRLVKMNAGECKAMVFCGASKSATMALAMVAIADLGATAAVVPCLLFYALQMLMDSLLSGYARRFR